MSFTAQTAFEARITNNSRDNLSHIAGKYYVSTTPTDCDAGQLCTRDSLLDCEGFASVKNENTWKMVAATSSADANDVIFACDTYDNQLLTAPDGNNYFIGQQTLGLGVPAGRYGNFTRINFDGESVYRFGAGNVTYTATHQYFTIDSGKLVSAATAPTTAGDIYFTLRGTGTFVEGNSASFTYYDLVACKVNA